MPTFQMKPPDVTYIDTDSYTDVLNQIQNNYLPTEVWYDTHKNGNFRNPISSCNLRFRCIITYLVEPQKVSPLSVGNSLKPCSLSVDFGKALQHESVGFRKLLKNDKHTDLPYTPLP